MNSAASKISLQALGRIFLDDDAWQRQLVIDSASSHMICGHCQAESEFTPSCRNRKVSLSPDLDMILELLASSGFTSKSKQHLDYLKTDVY